MLYAFLIALVVAIVLGIAYYFELKSSSKQAADQQQLLNDYQRRVDEQQKLLEDYRALEKNFDNVGEGYEQALLAFDKMEEEREKSRQANEALEKRCNSLFVELNELKEQTQKKAEIMRPLIQRLESAVRATGDLKLQEMMAKILDLDDIPANQPPIERTDNVTVTQIADEAVRISGIDKSQYIKFESIVAPDAATTMLYTNLPKAVRALTQLLDNALKFTSDGTIKLLVNVDMEKMQVIYTVEDTGSGIEAADQERIFEPYVKLNQYFDGEGIGLTVARNVARRLGGDLVLDADYAGPGARFVLSLPI
jgi:signal transduction histidine kinase